MYVVIEYKPYEYERLVRWFETETEADAWCQEQPLEQYGPGYQVYRLMPDGTIESAECHAWEPTKYEGPLVTARIAWGTYPPGTPWIDRGVHRVPIECARPQGPFRDGEPNEEFRWRVVRTSTFPDGDRFGHVSGDGCVCGRWQDIEGIPEAVAELVAKYPYAEEPPCD